MDKVNHQKGRILVYTGNGKGKTTAAIGLAVRSIGREMNVSILQFIKSPERTYGEKNVLEKLGGAEIHQLGVGFTWTKTPEEHRKALKSAWNLAKEKLMSGEYDLVILDEINNALAIQTFSINDVLPIEEVIHTIKNRPPHVHVVLTGRDAKEEIKEIADLVSVINVEKHYYDEGVEAIYGIEY
jgi:cob(I)alamin adenosyltransferase